MWLLVKRETWKVLRKGLGSCLLVGMLNIRLLKLLTFLSSLNMRRISLKSIRLILWLLLNMKKSWPGMGLEKHRLRWMRLLLSIFSHPTLQLERKFVQKPLFLLLIWRLVGRWRGLIWARLDVLRSMEQKILLRLLLVKVECTSLWRETLSLMLFRLLSRLKANLVLR